MLGNLFGTLDRARFLFRDTLETVRAVVALKVSPVELLKHPASPVRTCSLRRARCAAPQGTNWAVGRTHHDG